MARPLTRTVHRRPFAIWLCAATVSTLGDSITFFALGWVAAGFGGDAASLVLTVESVPLCLLILVGGQLADRYGVRRVLLGCDAAMLLVMAVFACVSLAGVTLWSLMALGLVSGTVAALRRPAEGVLPRLFATPEELGRLMATTGTSLQLARLVGPAVGGVLVAVGGLATTSLLDALSYGLVLVAILLVRPPYEHEHASAGGTPSRGGRGVADGAWAAARTPGVPAMLLAVVGLAATVLPLVMLCVPLAGRDRGWSAGQTGAVSAAWLVGGLVVMLVVARRGVPPRRVAVAGLLVAAAAVSVLAVTRDPMVALLAQGVVGVGTSLLTTTLLPAFVASTPPGMLARFQSLLGLAQTGPVLLATPALGLVAERAGVEPALAVVAVLLALTAVPATRLSALTTAGERDEQQRAGSRLDAERSPTA